MSIDNFELASIPTNYIVIDDDNSFEFMESYLLNQDDLQYPYDPYFQGWQEAFLDEIPILSYAQSTYDEFYQDEEFPVLFYEDVFPVFDVAFSPLYNIETFEVVIFAYYKWASPHIDEFYTFALFTWFLGSLEEFPIVFPPYRLISGTEFDFGDSPLRYNLIDEFSMLLPTLYFYQPFFTETYGDVTWATITTDNYPNFQTISWTLTMADLVLDDIKPTITFVLRLLEGFPSLITTWILISVSTMEMTIPWIYSFREPFDFIPPINSFEFSYFPLIENFEVTFYLTYTETFDIPVSFSLLFDEEMGDYQFILITTDVSPYILLPQYTRYDSNIQKYIITKRFTDIPDFVDYFRLSYFRYHTIMEDFIDWGQIGFKTWFDFDDFDCREYTSDISCTPCNIETFEISYIDQYRYNNRTVDTFEQDAPEIEFIDSVFEKFFDFDILHLYGLDTFEFSREDINHFPVFYDDFTLLYTIIWQLFIEYDFNTNISNYLQHIEDNFSFDVTPIAYYLFLEDDIESVGITINETPLLEKEYTLIKENGRTMGYDYSDY